MEWIEVVSVSLGSRKRDHVAEVEVGDLRFRVRREGTDGDLARAEEKIRAWDGKAAAIGLGGIDLFLRVAGKKFPLRDAVRLARAASRSPVVDGGGLKEALEGEIPAIVKKAFGLKPEKSLVLMVSATDRYGMAEGFARAGFPLLIGDLAFALGIPIFLRSLRSVGILANLLLPILGRLPFSWLYPTGSKQEKREPKYEAAFGKAHIWAGDFHYIRRYAPEAANRKIIVTNTLTPSDRTELRRRGARGLVTTAPDFQGRRFGANVLEALFVAYARTKYPDVPLIWDRRFGGWAELTGDWYRRIAQEIGYQPAVEFWA